MLYARARLIWVVVVFALLWLAALAAGRRALAATGAPAGPREYDTPPPRRPFLIMNPRSGGGKVERFDLADRARALGAEVVLLDGPGMDVTDLARQAVDDGADLLGVAGGDGTQALVAGDRRRARRCRSWSSPRAPATTSRSTSASTGRTRRPAWTPSPTASSCGWTSD